MSFGVLTKFTPFLISVGTPAVLLGLAIRNGLFNPYDTVSGEVATGGATWPGVPLGVVGQAGLITLLNISISATLDHGDYAGCNVCFGTIGSIVGTWMAVLASPVIKFAVGLILSRNLAVSTVMSTLTLLISVFGGWTIVGDMPTGIRIRNTLQTKEKVILVVIFSSLLLQSYFLFF